MKRIATGLAAGLIWLVVLLYGNTLALWIVAMLAGIVVLYEYHAMAHCGEAPPRARHVSLLLGLLPIVASLSHAPDGVTAGLIIALFLLFLFTIVTTASHLSPFLFLIRSAFGILYIGFFTAHLVLLHRLENGAAWLLYVSAITVAADTGAYFTGTLFGKTKLCPRVSPGKTFEGLAGGLLCSVVVGAILSPWLLARPFAVIIPLSIALALIGVTGDLGESVMKRSCKVKDSGTILPGHGGLLDRVDALLLAMPALYYLLRLGIV